jgi:hypothetical protein
VAPGIQTCNQKSYLQTSILAHRQANKIQVSEQLTTETCEGLNERRPLGNLIFRTSNPYTAYLILFWNSMDSLCLYNETPSVLGCQATNLFFYPLKIPSCIWITHEKSEYVKLRVTWCNPFPISLKIDISSSKLLTLKLSGSIPTTITTTQWYAFLPNGNYFPELVTFRTKTLLPWHVISLRYCTITSRENHHFHQSILYAVYWETKLHLKRRVLILSVPIEMAIFEICTMGNAWITFW